MIITMELLAYGLTARGFSVACRHLSDQAVLHIGLEREARAGFLRVSTEEDAAEEGMQIVLGQPPENDSRKNPRIYISNGSNVPHVLAEARDIQAKYSDWATRLLEAAVLRHDCQALVNMAREVFDVHMFVYDGLLRLAAYACDAPLEEDAYFTKIGDELYIGPKTVQIARENGIFENAKKHACAHVFHQGTVTAVTACIRDPDGFYLGYLFMTPEEKYAQAALPVADHLSACVAIAIGQQISASSPAGNEIGFPADVLRGERIPTPQIEHMLAIQKWSAGDPYQVLVMHCGKNQDRLPYYRYLLLSIPTDKRIVILNGALVVIQHDHFLEGSEDEAQVYFAPLFQEADMVCGVSNIANGFDAICELYRQATAAVSLPVIHDRIRFYYECICEDLLRCFGEHHSLAAAAHPAVRKLAAYHSSADLLETLYAYLICSGSYDACCQRLFIHRSTLKYRLGKIRELCGESCFAPDERMNILLSVCMVRAGK